MNNLTALSCEMIIGNHTRFSFFIAKNTTCALKSETKFKRCMKNFILEDFLIDLSEKLSKVKFDSVNINTDVDNVSRVFVSVFDKHAPLRLMSKREKNLSRVGTIDW